MKQTHVEKLSVSIPRQLVQILKKAKDENHSASLSEEIRRCLIKVYREEGKLR